MGSNGSPLGVLDSLNPQQYRAAISGPEPLLIIAGAGTGKTTTLVCRLVYLLLSGIPASRIVLLTFSRSAAGDLLRRVDGALARHSGIGAVSSAVRQVWGGTFHAFAQALLRRYGSWIGLSPSFTIMPRDDSEDLLDVVRADIGLAQTNRLFPNAATCAAIHSRWVNCWEPIDDILRNQYPRFAGEAVNLQSLFAAYAERKRKQNVLDFDDLLISLRFLLSDIRSGDAVRSLFDAVLVDEYQDTNALQAEIVRLLRPDGKGVTAVGDDAQSIYSFRGATVGNMFDFSQCFPGASIVPLEQNYRSTQTILHVANQVIAQASRAYRKTLWSDRASQEWPYLVTCYDEFAEAEFVAEAVLNRRETGPRLDEQAVLFRASNNSMALEAELMRRGIPFVKRGGLKFLEAAHIKDLLAFLRLAENPCDLVAGIRLLKLLPGIGAKRAREFLLVLDAAGGDLRSWTALTPPAATLSLWRPLVTLMQNLAAGVPQDLAGQVNSVLEFYKPLLPRLHDRPEERLEDLRQLERLAGRSSNRRDFLSELALDPPNSTQHLAGTADTEDDYLVLSTIHSAKGLEWDAVYVIHSADGTIPSSKAAGTQPEIDEELRLFYVALTRAKNSLSVSFPLRSGRSGASGLARLTRFLPPHLQQLFHRTGVGPSAVRPAAIAVPNATGMVSHQQSPPAVPTHSGATR